jgi:hypothetical protein
MQFIMAQKSEPKVNKVQKTIACQWNLWASESYSTPENLEQDIAIRSPVSILAL